MQWISRSVSSLSRTLEGIGSLSPVPRLARDVLRRGQHCDCQVSFTLDAANIYCAEDTHLSYTTRTDRKRSDMVKTLPEKALGKVDP